MVVSIDPCRRRGGLWWRIEAPAAGEDNRGEGERNTQEEGRRNAGKGEEGKADPVLEHPEAGVGNAGFSFFKNLKKP